MKYSLTNKSFVKTLIKGFLNIHKIIILYLGSPKRGKNYISRNNRSLIFMCRNINDGTYMRRKIFHEKCINYEKE